MPESNENTLVILFGVFTLVATLASLHYRDSLCCLFCRSLINAWSRNPNFDVEAMAGMQHSRRGTLRPNDEVVIELQPRTSFPMYFDPHDPDTDTAGGNTGIQEDFGAHTPLQGR